MDKGGVRNTTPPLEEGMSLRQTRPAFGLQREGRTEAEARGARLHICDYGWRSCEHRFVMPIPIALKSLFGIVVQLVTKKLRKLGITALHLITPRIPMVGKEVGSTALGRHIDQPAEGLR